jgi:hypothetical protein
MRLSYLAETYRLLPENHFGGRPNRSAEQALNLMVKKIHEAWRAYRVMSLVSFDMQDAFNGVHLSVLADWLRERRVPGDLVAWIESLCNGREASAVVGDYESPVSEVEHAGITQASPLSPILYVFYNANLLQGRIRKSEDSVGFIDDYNAWVTRPKQQGTRASCRRNCYQGPRSGRGRVAQFSKPTRRPSSTSFSRYNQMVGQRTTLCLGTRRSRQSAV